MPRKREAPRLYLRTWKSGAPTWIILDRGRQISTGFPEPERAEAEEFLSRYVTQTYGSPEGWQSPRLPPKGVPILATGVIYFVSSHEVADYPVKIGYSTPAAFKSRLFALQLANPHKLDLLARMPGTRTDEAEMHTNFAEARLRGEWFRRTPEMMELISSLHPQ